MAGESPAPGSRETLIASGREALYDLLAAVFEHFPNRLLPIIRNGELERFLAPCRDVGRGFRRGLALVSSYGSAIRERPDAEVLTELSVDRTRILRGTGHADMLPPYEALYKKRKVLLDSALEVRRFYRRAGLLPDEAVRESADYLCVELDFMKQLCLREQTLREAGAEVRETVTLEEEFLRIHLNWAADFCREVEKHASTDFYRGFGLILNAYIRADRERLRDLVR
jgi:TorA maturation chaperone TorD